MVSLLEEEGVGAEEEQDEWMRLLGGGGGATPAADASRPGADKVPATTDLLLEDDEGEAEVAAAAAEVALQGDTTVLLAAIRSRLAQAGKAAEYQAFLAAVAKEPVEIKAALAALSDHADLASEFRRVFNVPPDADWAEREVAAEEAAAAEEDWDFQEEEDVPAEAPTRAMEEEEEEEEEQEEEEAPAAAPASRSRGPPPIVGGVTRGAGVRIKQPGVAEVPVSRAAVPMSRAERVKHRLRAKMDSLGEEAEAAAAAAPAQPPSKRARTASLLPVARTPQDELAAADGEDEVSAATFLASVKSRLLEWGKVEQYHDFVLALAGTVDARAAVRILRGHDDLLRVFRRKFAPRANLMAIKAELDEENADGPRPPSRPPPGGLVKRELVKEELGGGGGPRPPSHPPSVKRETVKAEKAEVKREYLKPRPPQWDPRVWRAPVTIGDDSDGEEDEVEIQEASIATAVQKGKDECIAQLAKVLFQKERENHAAARVRLALVHYATRVAACPRFPRRLYILRGAPGVGKTEYAMQQLLDYADVAPDEHEAARLTHVCGEDDFFGEYVGDALVYRYEGFRLESASRKNEARVRLAMEAGIHPLFVDCTNERLWEMRPYVLLAERLGYVVDVVEPRQICEKWNDVHWLGSAQETVERKRLGKVVPKGVIGAQLQAFEPLPKDQDPLQAIRAAVRPRHAARLLEAIEVATPVPPPPQRKETTGQGAARYVPTATMVPPHQRGGKGAKRQWGV